MRKALLRDLTDGVAALGERGALTIAELAKAGIVVWEVRRDPTGTPRGRYWPGRALVSGV